MGKSKSTGFHRPEHDLAYGYTGTHRPVVSLAHSASAYSASAALHDQYGKLYLQPNGASIVAGVVPGVYASIGRFGVSGLAEQSNIWVIIGTGTGIGVHTFAYAADKWAELLPKLTLTATACNP